MLVIPAIDLKDGQCVRLRQGRMEDSTVFSDDPVEQARQWVEQGARRLHIVDLNGAFAGTPVNGEIVAKILKAFPDLPIQIGGGIRDLGAARFYAEVGVRHLIIGTQAVKQPEFVAEACEAFPGQIIVGIDAIDGMVATEGWADVSELEASAVLARFAGMGVAAVVYTDIARDGMMQGANIAATVALAERTEIPVIASGGVSSMDDLMELEAASRTGVGIIGAITGRAIYEGKLDLAEAQSYCDSRGN